MKKILLILFITLSTLYSKSSSGVESKAEISITIGDNEKIDFKDINKTQKEPENDVKISGSLELKIDLK